MRKPTPPFEGAAAEGMGKVGAVHVIRLAALSQPNAPLRVSPELARVAHLTRRRIDVIRLGRHRRRMAAYRLREVAA